MMRHPPSELYSFAIAASSDVVAAAVRHRAAQLATLPSRRVRRHGADFLGDGVVLADGPTHCTRSLAHWREISRQRFPAATEEMGV